MTLSDRTWRRTGWCSELFARHTCLDLDSQERELAETSEDLFISAISTFDIARLLSNELLRLRHRFVEWKEISFAELRALPVDLTHEIAWEANNLSGSFHNDPADRLLVATARLMKLTLVTADNLILRYPHVKTMSALR